MSNKRAVPVTFRAAGLSDSFSVGDAFPGAMSVLQNLIPNPGANGQWVARPAAFTLVSSAASRWASFNWLAAPWGSGWGAINGPGVINGIYVVGNLVYGMIASTSGIYAGKDVPFCYDMQAQVFRDFTIPGGSSSLPTSPANTGDWVPPRFSGFPGKVIVTHPGFPGGAGPYFGWMDSSGFTDNTHTGNTHSNTTIDNLSSNVLLAGWQVGQVITGTGIPANTTITSIATGGTSITISNAATATGTGVALTVAGGTVNTPMWGSGNTNANVLINPPLDVFNFNGRAYYAVPKGGIAFSDVGFPLQITNANQFLTPNNGLDVTCFGGLPINQTQTGPISTLFAFQGDSNILKITGDAAFSNLTMNSVPNGLGTLAPNSIASTPLGLAFIAPDGLRYVDFDGNAQSIVGANGEGVNIPLINALNPSRINAAYNEDVYRFSVHNGSKTSTPWEDYWLHVTKKAFSGPHTDPSTVVAPFQQSAGVATGHGFVFAMQGFLSNLCLGSVIPTLQAAYIENGIQLSCFWQTCYTEDNQMMTENSIVESTLLCSVPVGSGMTIAVLNELGTILDQLQLPGPLSGPFWGTMTWGVGTWGGSTGVPYQRDLAWHLPIVFKQGALRVSVGAGTGLILGPWRYNNIILGYRLETFGAYV